MELRNIEVGMVIYCESKEERKMVLKKLKEQGYTWRSGEEIEVDEESKLYNIKTIYVTDGGILYSTVTDNKNSITVPELVIEEKLSAVEILQICSEICDEHETCEKCEMMDNCYYEIDSDKEKVIEICEKWKKGFRNRDICIGDIVIFEDDIKAVVLDVAEEDNEFYVFTEVGCVERKNAANLKVTGKEICIEDFTRLITGKYKQIN